MHVSKFNLAVCVVSKLQCSRFFVSFQFFKTTYKGPLHGAGIRHVIRNDHHSALLNASYSRFI